jgi:addiction module HigA family antidote
MEILKGVHPGLVLERELKKRHLSKGAFAISVSEYPQTLSAILKGKRSMNTSLALRIEDALGLDEGFLMLLQIYYDIKQEKLKHSKGYHPNLTKFRRALFWDTKLETIDWKRQKNAIINRVFERGNITEKKEILRFYGRKDIEAILSMNKIESTK